MYEVRNAVISEVKEGLIWKPIRLSEIKRLDVMNETEKEKYVSHLVSKGVLRKIEHDKMAYSLLGYKGGEIFYKKAENVLHIK